MTKKQINLPLALVFSLITAFGGVALGAGVVRSDVGHLSDRMSHVEDKVESVSSEVEELRVVQTSSDARDLERWISVERRLGAIETSLSTSADTLQTLRTEVGTLLRRRR